MSRRTVKLVIKIIKDKTFKSGKPWKVQLEWSTATGGINGLNCFRTWEQARDYALMERKHHMEWESGDRL